jgi:hypothetical protein
MSYPTQSIDFTTWRKGRRTRGSCKIEVCPECGRKGEVTRYTDGTVSIVHRGHVVNVPDLLSMFHVDDSCFVPKPKKAAVQP